MSPVGICIARDGPASDSDGVLLARQVVLRVHGHVLSVDHVRLCHPYIYCLLLISNSKIVHCGMWSNNSVNIKCVAALFICPHKVTQVLVKVPVRVYTLRKLLDAGKVGHVA